MEFKDKVLILETILIVILITILTTIAWTSYWDVVELRKELREASQWEKKYNISLDIINKTISSNVYKEPGLLEKILTPEIVKREGWVCVDYAMYYNKTLSIKYPRLDIKVMRMVDICNNLTLCNNYHAFIVVGGYGGECIMDQTNIACYDVIKTNLTLEEANKLRWW